MKHYSPVRAILLICFCMIGITLAAQQPSPATIGECGHGPAVVYENIILL